MALILVRGDTVVMTFTLTEDDVAFEIPTGSTVTAGLRYGDTAIAGPWDCDEGHDDADWPNGVVAWDVEGTDSEVIDLRNRVAVEIQVTISGAKQTWISDGIMSIREQTIDPEAGHAGNRHGRTLLTHGRAHGIHTQGCCGRTMPQVPGRAIQDAGEAAGDRGKDNH